MTALQEPEMLSPDESLELSEDALLGLSIARFGRRIAETMPEYVEALNAIPLELKLEDAQQIHNGVYDVMIAQNANRKKTALIAADRALIALAARSDEVTDTTRAIFEIIDQHGYIPLGRRLLELM